MKTTSIMIVGVGGQGSLLASRLLGTLLTDEGYDVKVSEVHGMSQRGGDVHSDLRLSTDPIFSDLIPQGGADLILSMEPMEALRYLPYLAEGGAVVTSSKPFVNIPDYPAETELLSELDALPKVVRMDIEAVAKGLLAPRSANMVLLGMAAPHIGIISPEDLRQAIRTVFARKGEKVVEDNLKAFDAGYEGIQ